MENVNNIEEEIFDIYTRDGKYLGTKPKSFCHSDNPGVYHKPVWIWIINSNNEILIQKRAATKKQSPNKWDMPCAGHVVAGESSIEGATREIKEELGIDTKESDYEHIGEYIYDKNFEIAQIYLIKLDNKISDFQLQKEEVAEVKWLSLDNFKKIFYSNEFCGFNIEYKDMIVKLLGERLK